MLATAKFGQTANVPVYVTRNTGSSATGTVTLTATSESDATKTATGLCALSVPAPGVSYTLDPASPNGANGWYTSNVALDWTVTDAATQSGCADETFTTDGSFTRSCTATSDGGTTGPVEVSLKRDATAPAVSHSLSPPAVGGFYHDPTVTISAADSTSGLASTEYRLDGGPWTAYSAPFTVTGDGSHTVDYRATDNAGNVGDPASATEAKVRLGRVGIDRVVGQLADPLRLLVDRPDLHEASSRLTIEQLAKQRDLDPRLQIVDVRGAGETADGTIPGARVIPLATLPRSLAALDPTAPVAVYCASGHRSQVAASVLRAAGFTDVSDVLGGSSAWERAGLPLATEGSPGARLPADIPSD